MRQPALLVAAVLCTAAAAALLSIPISRVGTRCNGAVSVGWRNHGDNSSSSDAASTAAGQPQHSTQQAPWRPAQWAVPVVPTCNVLEGSRELCEWCNATFASGQQHPLHDRMEAGYLPGSNPCAMPPGLLDKLRSGGNVTINVVGGSMTFGHGCDDGATKYAPCAWPARLQARLSQLFPAAHVTVANLAKPSYSYTEFLADWDAERLASSDVLIVDLQVNSQAYASHDSWDIIRQMEELDAFLHQALAAAYAQRRRQGLLFVETFRLCAASPDDCSSHCSRARQGFMDFNHTGSPMRYWWCNRWWLMATVERPVVQHYGLPIASYRDAVWPDAAAPSQLLPCHWNGMSHPDVFGHILMGDVVAHALLRAAEAAEATAAQQPTSSSIIGSSSSGDDGKEEEGQQGSSGGCSPLRPPTRFHHLLPARAFCGTGSSGGGGVRMTAERPDGFQPLLNTGCWAFFADRPGKPGWICQQGLGEAAAAPSAAGAPAPGAGGGSSTAPSVAVLQAAAGADALVFRVAFSSRPQLEVTFLISYTHMAAAAITLLTADGAAEVEGARWELDAAIPDKFSVPRTAVFYHASAAREWAAQKHARQLPDSVGAGEYLLAVALPRSQAATQKFKLLALASC